ncbi:MAG: AraC family transcriptional regulator [Verrucomicrobia bacterium]|nr:AraC family transcriptional regulator [Verrucomicrobiota bacterium]MBU1735983.1 AraC family transcriptional regulator [Verrucomicrobiota bacterium]MBU1857599.1 AraC family transcriptional regulator [Verrucomicrobiota bacterium]
MNLELLCRHKFQFISYCPVFHADESGVGRIHINDDYHLLHITRGTGTLFIEDKQHALQPGVVAAIPPFVRFYFKINAPFEMLNIHYRLWLENGDLLEEHAVLPMIFRPASFRAIKTILRTMQNTLKSDLPDKLLLAAMAHELVTHHVVSNQLIETDRPVIDARLMNACRRLSAPDYAVLQATEIARLCGLSVSQMNRLFQKCFHVSPHKFWEKKRFVELCHQLRSSDLPASKIAAQFGMEDNAYFSRWFKKMAGCAPSEFRQRGI